MRLRIGSTPRGRSSASGVRGSSKSAWYDWTSEQGAGDHPSFPPNVVVAVKALACELPYHSGLPISHLICEAAIERGIVASIGETTVWRWLSEDAIRPWSHRSWIFPRDPDFQKKAGPIVDLYPGRWRAKPLTADDYVISADEKTSIQA